MLWIWSLYLYLETIFCFHSANVLALGKTTICSIFKNSINPNFVLQAKNRTIVHPSSLLTSFASFRCLVSSHRSPAHAGTQCWRRAMLQLLEAEYGGHTCKPSAQEAESSRTAWVRRLNPVKGWGWRAVQWVGCLPECQNSRFGSPALLWLDVVSFPFNPSTEEVEARGFEVQGYPGYIEGPKLVWIKPFQKKGWGGGQGRKICVQTSSNTV